MKITFKEARPPDAGTLLRLMREYYAYDGIRLQINPAKARLREFLADAGLGKAWLIAGRDGEAAGYLVVSRGYGLEHGRNVTIDELYIREKYRGAGLGGRVLRFLTRTVRSWGVESIHTEVERNNARAVRFWKKSGFHAHARYPMVKRLRRVKTMTSSPAS